MPLFGRRHPEPVLRTTAGSRVTEVLGIVSAIPAAVMPSEVDRPADDLVAQD